MKLCTTTSDFSIHCDNEYDRIKEVKNAGFKYVDLGMNHNQCAQFMCDDWKEKAKRLKGYAEDLGVQFVQAHSPMFDTIERNPNENWNERFNLTIRSIEVCKELGIPMTVVHSGVKRNAFKEQTMELNKKFYELLVPTMEKTGVCILVENIATKDNDGKYYLNSGERLAEFIDYFDHPLLKACWDLGHGNVSEGEQYEQITAVGKRLMAIHYNDNDRISDMHYAPFLASLDNDVAIRALIDIGFKGPFTLECTRTVKYKVKAFDKLRGLDNSSIEIVRAYEKALYETGKYLLTAYGIYEE